MIWAVSIFDEGAAAASRLQPQNAGAHHRARAQPGGAGPGARAAGAPGAGAGALALRPGAESAGGAPPSRRVAPCLIWVALGALSWRCPTTGGCLSSPTTGAASQASRSLFSGGRTKLKFCSLSLQAPGPRRQSALQATAQHLEAKAQEIVVLELEHHPPPLQLPPVLTSPADHQHVRTMHLSHNS